MDTSRRQQTYALSGRPMTARQRRRLVKKAGADPSAIVERDSSPSCPPAERGFRILLGFHRQAEL